jgi:hypothetical protein
LNRAVGATSSHPSRLLFALVLLACAWAAPPARAAQPGVTLLPSGGSSIHFMVAVPEPVLTPHPRDAAFSMLSLEGYEAIGTPGAPLLPTRVITVAVPPTGDVRVSASGRAAVTTEGLLLAPAPVDVPGVDPDVPVRLRGVYDLPRPGGGALARLLGVGWLRDQRVARIAIEPLSYDPVARRLSATRQVDVTVEIDGAAAAVTPSARTAGGVFEQVYSEALLNPEQGRAWRRAEAAPGSPARPASAMGTARVVPGDTVYAQHRWVKVAVSSAGFYKVEFSQVRNLALFSGDTAVSLDSLRLFTWPGYPVLAENSYCDTCGYREVAIRFVENAAGDQLHTFNRNDEYFYFHALGPSGWSDTFDPSYADTLYLDHPYETVNYYYLTIATGDAPVGGTPKRIGTRDGTVGTGGTVPATFPERAHYEQDYLYYPHLSPQRSSRPDLQWEKWFWASLDIGNTLAVSGPEPDAPGADVSQPYRLRARVWGVNTYDPCSYADPPAFHLLDTSINGLALPRLEWGDWSGYANVTRIVDTVLTNLREQNTLQFSVPAPAQPCPARQDRVALAWVELYYRRFFQASLNQLAFVSEPGGGTWEFHIDGFTAPATARPRVFDVTDPLAPVEVTGLSYVDGAVAGTFQLRFQTTDAGLRRYRVLTDTSIVRVPSASVTDPPRVSAELVDLGAETLGADHVIIYYDAFKAAADTLAAWRRARLPVETDGPYQVFTVPISSLYDQFSGGRVDPGAIRKFLRSAFFNWSRRPSFVTLLGDASYDFKDLRGLAPSGMPGALIPSYENGFDVGLGRQFASDDWMLNVDNAVVTVPDFVGGRIPAGDVSSANAYVRKLLAYERGAPFGVYRNRIMLVADDDVKGDARDDLLWEHLRQTALLDLNAPPHLDRRYVYLHKYEYKAGGTRPGARDAIFENVDEGVQVFNFVGHGSAFKISDEGVFVYSDPASLHNSDRPTVFISASCDVGRYNDPELPGLGENLVLSPNGGAVGVISATEESFSYLNSTLNLAIYTSLFDRDTTNADGTYHEGLGEALLSAKLGSVNSQKYQLMGDAGVRINLPRHWVSFSLWDSAGTSPVDSVKRGQTITYRGEVRRSPKSDAPLVAVDGIADLLIEDAQPLEQAPACRDVAQCSRPNYYYYAGAMFRGDVSVTAGRFEGRFVAPLEAHLGGRSRVRAYVQGQLAGGATDGAGSVFTTVATGGASGADTEGPRIALSFAGGSTSVRKDATLQVDLSDVSGILTTGHTPQNGIVVTVDDNSTTRYDITPSFRYAADSHQDGNASFQLPGLAEGAHTIRVSAADNLAVGLASGQHRSSAVIEFNVVETPPLRVARAYLFPNPTSSDGPGGGGTFVVDAPGDSINVLLRLYTVSGKLIRTLSAPGGGLGQVQLPWDGRDAEGDPLANGVYLFKVHAYARESDGTSSPRQKAIGEGRFVIVNR